MVLTFFLINLIFGIYIMYLNHFSPFNLLAFNSILLARSNLDLFLGVICSTIVRPQLLSSFQHFRTCTVYSVHQLWQILVILYILKSVLLNVQGIIICSVLGGCLRETVKKLFFSGWATFFLRLPLHFRDWWMTFDLCIKCFVKKSVLSSHLSIIALHIIHSTYIRW